MLLIAMQRPDATLVADYQTWQKQHQRHVNKGEKGIQIIAPSPYKAKKEREVLDPGTGRPKLDAQGKPVTEIEAKLTEMEKAPELAAVPETMPEKAANGFHSKTCQKSGKNQEKASVLKELTEKKTGSCREGHGRKKPARTEESR